MNKDNAIKCFRDQVMPTIKEEEKEHNNGNPNYQRREQFWLKFIEIAFNRGWINREKYERWTIPPFVNSRYDPQNTKN